MTEIQRCVKCGGKNHQADNCPHKEKGSRCFKCNEFGHIAKTCKTMKESTSAESHVEAEDHFTGSPKSEDDSGNTMLGVLHLSSWKFKAFHGQTQLQGCICTTATESFLRQSTFRKLDYKPEPNNGPTIVKAWDRDIYVYESYTLHMVIGKFGYYIPLHVVDDKVIPIDLLLGMNFIRQVDITIKAGQIKITRTTDDENRSEVTDSDEENTDWWKSVRRMNI